MRTRSAPPPGSGGQERGLVPLGDLAGEERAGDDRPEALHREGAVDRQEQRAVRGPLRHLAARAARAPRGARRAPRPSLAETGTIGAPSRNVPFVASRTSCSRSGSQSAPSPGSRSAFVDRDEPARHAEQAADVEVLAGLGHDALVRRDDEHHEVDAARARRHRADEPLVAGDVHDARHGAVGQRQVREAELDRDPAPLLLAEPVGVDPGERADERGLAVIDVPGGADDDALHVHPGGAAPDTG